MNIVSFSGGKDSTAMLLMMLEKGIPVDDIVCADTGMEFPQMYEHWKQVEKYIGRKLTILRNEKSFEYFMFDHVKTKGKKKGQKGYGWPTVWTRWCTSNLKRDLIKKYLQGKEYTQFIGIAYDEPRRHENIEPNVRHPLFDWKVTEKQALEYCYSKGFYFGGLYEHFSHINCWCCPLKRIGELKTLFTYYPDLWEKMVDMEQSIGLGTT